MPTLIIAILILGVAYLVLFHQPKHASKADLQKWFSYQLSAIAETLSADIEKDKQGVYPHKGRQVFSTKGQIVYPLLDKSYQRFDVSDKNTVNTQLIMQTPGYKQLDEVVRSLNLSMRIDESELEGDGVDSFEELDEYIDDIPRHFTITISGW